MNDIKTYAIGNGEITLTEEDAEQLRIMLQTDYLAKVINEIVDKNIDDLAFPSKSSRRHFVDNMVRLHDDLVNYDSIYYEETIEENIFRRAEELGLVR